MLSVRAATEGDAERIAAIYNAALLECGSTFETTPRSAEMLQPALRDQSRYPHLVALEDDRVIGWASLSAYRARDCYAGVADFSIYLAKDRRGKGVGSLLLDALLAEARARGFVKVLSRVFVTIAASRALCRRLGFREVGTYEKHGRSAGQWMDVVIVERLIPENMEMAS